jgi:hypothetical protein
MLRAFAFLCLVNLSACASNESLFSDKVTVDPVNLEDGIPKYAQAQGQQAVSGDGQINWFTCTQKASAPYFVMLNPAPQAWRKADACAHPAALEFLEHGFNIVAINRPFKEVLGDDESVNQVKETIEFLQKEDRRMEGLWAAGDASVLALRLARQLPWKILIIGNGIYDWEQTLKESSDPDFVARMKALPGSNESRFAEKRSAAWELSGVPRLIYLYHSGKNAQVLPAQASRFRDSLAASEYRVELFVLDEDTQEIRPEYQRGVLSRILSTYHRQE